MIIKKLDFLKLLTMNINSASDAYFTGGGFH